MRAALFLFILLMLSLAPSAGAQYGRPVVDMKVYPYDGYLMPEVGQAEVRIDIKVLCQPGYVATEPGSVDLRLRNWPSYANVVLQPSSFRYQFQPQQCLANSGSYMFTTRAIVSVTRDAPAYQDGLYEVIAHVTQPGLITPQSNYAVAAFTIKNDYVPHLEVRTQDLQQTVAPHGRLVFPLEIINHGNGPTRAKITVAPESSLGLEMVNTGGDVVLESRAGRGDAAVYKVARNVEVVAGAAAGVYPFQLRFESTFDGASTAATLVEESSIGFAVIVEGEATQRPATHDAKDVPTVSAPMAPILAMLLLGVAAFRRRLV